MADHNHTTHTVMFGQEHSPALPVRVCNGRLLAVKGLPDATDNSIG